jgi:hypothetical protein
MRKHQLTDSIETGPTRMVSTAARMSASFLGWPSARTRVTALHTAPFPSRFAGTDTTCVRPARGRIPPDNASNARSWDGVGFAVLPSAPHADYCLLSNRGTAMFWVHLSPRKYEQKPNGAFASTPVTGVRVRYLLNTRYRCLSIVHTPYACIFVYLRVLFLTDCHTFAMYIEGMPRLSMWLEQQQLYSYLPPEQQWLIHEFYLPSESLDNKELLKYRKAITAKRPGLPTLAGKAVRNLQLILSGQKAPYPGQTVISTHGERITVRGAVRPQIDMDKLSLAYYLEARGGAKSQQ